MTAASSTAKAMTRFLKEGVSFIGFGGIGFLQPVRYKDGKKKADLKEQKQNYPGKCRRRPTGASYYCLPYY
jgi:hypothetical protein